MRVVDQRPSRDEIFMDIALLLRKRSTCNRGKVGALLVKDHRIVATGYNGSPPGEPHCWDLGCDIAANVHITGCRRAIHAEANVIAYAARHAGGGEGSTMYCTHAACEGCAGLILSAGIVKVIYKWPYRLTEGLELLQRHIEVVQYEST